MRRLTDGFPLLADPFLLREEGSKEEGDQSKEESSRGRGLCPLLESGCLAFRSVRESSGSVYLRWALSVRNGGGAPGSIPGAPRKDFGDCGHNTQASSIHWLSAQFLQQAIKEKVKVHCERVGTHLTKVKTGWHQGKFTPIRMGLSSDPVVEGTANKELQTKKEEITKCRLVCAVYIFSYEETRFYLERLGNITISSSPALHTPLNLTQRLWPLKKNKDTLLPLYY